MKTLQAEPSTFATNRTATFILSKGSEQAARRNSVSKDTAWTIGLSASAVAATALSRSHAQDGSDVGANAGALTNKKIETRREDTVNALPVPMPILRTTHVRCDEWSSSTSSAPFLPSEARSAATFIPAIVEPPRTPSSARGYCEAPATRRDPLAVRAEMGRCAAALRDMQARLRGIAAHEVVASHCPHVHAAQDRGVDAIALAIVVDAFLACPRVLSDSIVADAVEVARTKANPCDVVQKGGDHAPWLGLVSDIVGLSFGVLGHLLSDPAVANVIAPLLVQGLNVVVPGLGAALAPVLPLVLPLVGQMFSAQGAAHADQMAPLDDVLTVVMAFTRHEALFASLVGAVV
jgi:hypothetical protein